MLSSLDSFGYIFGDSVKHNPNRAPLATASQILANLIRYYLNLVPPGTSKSHFCALAQTLLYKERERGEKRGLSQTRWGLRQTC
jgi:hypothetical protein